MDNDGEYLKVNRAGWDERAPAHAASVEYAVQRFVAEPDFLSHVVTFDLPRLGDLRGLRGVHLQCHIGTDTLSLARLGARMSGLDFSAASLDQARRLAEQTSTEIDYHESDVYKAVEVFGREQFNFVFTGVGALCWLPSVQRWAETVAGLLKPGGRLFIREGHPVLWAVDDARTDAIVLRYPYFERDEPMVWDEGGTYVETDVEFTSNITHEWNHGIGDVISAVLDNGMDLVGFVEHQSVPWEGIPGLMEKLPNEEWQLTDERWRLPLTYTLQAIKRQS